MNEHCQESAVGFTLTLKSIKVKWGRQVCLSAWKKRPDCEIHPSLLEKDT